YFKPTAAGAKITAVFEAGKYTATVNVKLDNAAKTGATVELWQGNVKKYGTTDTAGVYTVDALVGTYKIYVDVDGSAAGYTLEDTGKTVEAKVTNDGTATVDYYTVKLVAGTGGKVDFGTGAATAATVSKIYLAGTSGIQIAAAANTTTDHYRFSKWAAAPAEGTINSDTTAVTTYTLPASVSGTDGVTLTASFVQQFKVTLNVDTTSSWGSITQPAGFTAVNPTGSYEGYVDKGTKVAVVVAPTTAHKLTGWTTSNTVGANAEDMGLNGNTDSAPVVTETKDSKTYYVGATAAPDRNTIHVLPRKDVTLTVTFEVDSYDGKLKLTRMDGTTAYTAATKMEVYKANDPVKPENLVINNSNQNTSGNQITNKDNIYTIPALTTGQRYDVYINGYKAITIGTAAESVFKLAEFKLLLAMDCDNSINGDWATGHTATIKTAFAPYISAAGTPIYLPGNATVTVTAVATAGTGFRVNKSGDAAQWTSSPAGGTFAPANTASGVSTAYA
ncbi:MAG: hypothetical protein RSB55_09185, partial [Oscillospiraceae bacterium]